LTTPVAPARRSVYPNPAREAAVITFTLRVGSQVRLETYDVLGRSVGVLIDAYLLAGRHRVPWEVEGLGRGTYLYRLQVPGATWGGIITLVK